MRKLLFGLISMVFLVTACGSVTPAVLPTATPKIDRYPQPADFSGLNIYTELPKHDPGLTDSLQMDLRSSDLSKLDLSLSRADLLYATFDSKTIWPEKMPADFDWQSIMEIGKNPGLGIRNLQEQGITGKGVSIAIIDQPLLVEHQEYAKQLRLYEEINIHPNNESQLHGPAVASIAVGKTIGVAPDANLYYIASNLGIFDGQGGFSYDYSYIAQAVRRILEINSQLPDEQKIRAISISASWKADQKGYNDIIAAVDEAKANGIFVVSCSLEQTYGWKFNGLGREPFSNPDNVKSYIPGIWWAKSFYDGKYADIELFIPMDSRTTASPTGYEDFVFYRQGGWSWAIPYLAGTYALAVQVDPSITPEKFWQTALDTGQTIELTHAGKTYKLGPILDPAALVTALKH